MAQSPAQGIIVAYGSTRGSGQQDLQQQMPVPSAPPWAHMEQAPDPIFLHHTFIHTCGNWPTERTMELGLQRTTPLVRFDWGPWHGWWGSQYFGGVPHMVIFWHWTGQQELVGPEAKIYVNIGRTASYKRGHGERMEHLTPVSPGC